MILASTLLALALGPVARGAEIGVANTGHASNPTWSRDGQWLAFEMNTFGGRVDLFVVKVQAGNGVGAPTQVVLPGGGSAFAGGGSLAVSPTWHPQGRIIFEGTSSGGTSRLYDWAPAGQGATELLATSQVAGDLSWPAISADGRKVAFVSDVTGLGDLYVWDRGSNAVTQVLTSPFSEAAPEYAANGDLAYTRKNQGGEDLFLVQGGKSVPWVGGNGDQSRPTWSAGQVVFFSNERGQDHWDVVVSAGVGQKRTVARDVRLPDRASPALTPDGQWVAYGMTDPGKDDRIAFSRLDGSKTVEIPTGLVACGEPSITAAAGRWYLAFTALPGQGSAWRRLHVIDITGKL